MRVLFDACLDKLMIVLLAYVLVIESSSEVAVLTMEWNPFLPKYF